jgi:hypothetical protein
MNLQQIEIPVTPLKRTDGEATLEDVRDEAVAQACYLLSEVEPDGDLSPFLVLGNESGLWFAAPRALPEEAQLSPAEQVSFFIENLVPMLLMQQRALAAAVVLSVWTAPIEDVRRGMRPSEHPERGEAIKLMLADAVGREEVLGAEVRRSGVGAPELGSFDHWGDQLETGFRSAFHRGFADDFPVMTDDEAARFAAFPEYVVERLRDVIYYLEPNTPLPTTLILALPEEEDLTAYMLQEDSQPDEMVEIMKAFSDDLPLACAYAEQATDADSSEESSGERWFVLLADREGREASLVVSIRRRGTGEAEIEDWREVERQGFLPFHSSLLRVGLRMSSKARACGRDLDLGTWLEVSRASVEG